MHQVRLEDFSALDLGDVRRDKRFITLINNISTQPGSSIPRQNERWYDIKATYEFFKNEEVSQQALQKALTDYGYKQVADQLQLLVVHDISTISFNKLQAEGLGYTGHKDGRGILCFSSMAVSTEGLPLSLLYQHSWTRPLEGLGKAAQRHSRDFEDKESYRWYAAMKEVNDVLGDPIHKIHIADREADIYELFFSAFEANTDLIIRAKHNRKTAEGSLVWDLVSNQQVAGIVSLNVPDATGKKKQSVQAEVRYYTVKIIRPWRSSDQYECVVMTGIEIKELSGAGRADEELIHWKLLTSLDIKSVAEAMKCVQWYSYRWLIERFHYVLKSGTKIEELQLKQAESLQKAIAIYSIAGFRIMQLVYESRHHPEINCEVVITPVQWKVLYILIHKKKETPKQPPTLYDAVTWIGKLGGHIGRTSDGPPGLQTVWLGYQKLCNAADLYEIIA
jgi:hypothetical protein